MIPLLLGAGLAIVLAIAAKVTRFDQDRSFYPTVLIVIAAYYVLFAFMSGEAIVVEVFVASAFTIAAVAGGIKWPVLTGIAIVMHGVFDFLHPTIITNGGVPEWWPWFCAGVDLVLGTWVILLSFMGKADRGTSFT